MPVRITGVRDMASFALFNDVSFSYCIASVVDEWMRMEHWWNDTDRGKLKYWEKYLSNCMLCPP